MKREIIFLEEALPRHLWRKKTLFQREVERKTAYIIYFQKRISDLCFKPKILHYKFTKERKDIHLNFPSQFSYNPTIHQNLKPVTNTSSRYPKESQFPKPVHHPLPSISNSVVSRIDKTIWLISSRHEASTFPRRISPPTYTRVHTPRVEYR